MLRLYSKSHTIREKWKIMKPFNLFWHDTECAFSLKITVWLSKRIWMLLKTIRSSANTMPRLLGLVQPIQNTVMPSCLCSHSEKETRIWTITSKLHSTLSSHLAKCNQDCTCQARSHTLGAVSAAPVDHSMGKTIKTKAYSKLLKFEVQALEE